MFYLSQRKRKRERKITPFFFICFELPLPFVPCIFFPPVTNSPWQFSSLITCRGLVPALSKMLRWAELTPVVVVTHLNRKLQVRLSCKYTCISCFQSWLQPRKTEMYEKMEKMSCLREGSITFLYLKKKIIILTFYFLFRMLQSSLLGAGLFFSQDMPQIRSNEIWSTTVLRSHSPEPASICAR